MLCLTKRLIKLKIQRRLGSSIKLAKVSLLMETVNLTRHNTALSDIKIFRGLHILLSGRFLAISPLITWYQTIYSIYSCLGSHRDWFSCKMGPSEIILQDRLRLWSCHHSVKPCEWCMFRKLCIALLSKWPIGARDKSCGQARDSKCWVCDYDVRDIWDIRCGAVSARYQHTALHPLTAAVQRFKSPGFI